MVDRFIRYTKINTQSNSTNNQCPSTPGQLRLANIIARELEEIGLLGVEVDPNGYLYASLPGNTNKTIPAIGFIAHMDTSPDFNGANVEPKIHKNYHGEELVLNSENNITLSPDEFPELMSYKGCNIITSNGLSLLGADDKAGIVEIIEAIKYLMDHPEIKHGPIKIAFTPDEEIGRGADLFNIEKFGAEWAYTVDGGPVGELEYETFNAAYARIQIKGRNVHPGTAKDRMINSMQLAMDLHAQLPERDRPEKTSGYEGFFHLLKLEGNVENTSMEYIIRDHCKIEFQKRKDLIRGIVDKMNNGFKKQRVFLDLKDQYFNMKEKIEPVFHIVSIAEKSMNQIGILPEISPVRGGTDGAKLSYMGLPTPNLFTGGHNFHGKYEFIPIESMELAVKVIVKIAENTAIQYS